MKRWALLVFAALFATIALAEQVYYTTGNQPVNSAVLHYLNASGQAVPVSSANPLPIAQPGTYIPASGAIDSSVAINAGFASGTVYLGCGTYNFTSSISMPSNSALLGAGPCTILQGATDLIVNANPSTGNSNISIKNLTLQFTALSGNHKLVTFTKASKVIFDSNTMIGDGTSFTQDGIAFIGSDHYTVTNNKTSAITGNTCYDNWGGSHDAIIADNQCDGALYGILINGLDTNFAVDTTYNFVVHGNKIYNINQVGIWAGGLYDAGSGHYGVVKAIDISDNVIDTVTTFYGVQVSDGLYNAVNNNIISNTVGDGIRVGSQNAGVTAYTGVSNNVINNANSATGTYSGIYVNNLADHTKLTSNTIAGAHHVYAISVTSGVTANTIIDGVMQAGSSGTVADASTTPTKMSLNSTGWLTLTSPSTLCLGVAGFDCQATLDTGGNFYPASTTKNLGNVNFAWGQFWVIDPVARGSTPTGSGTCPINNQSGGNVGGTFKLNGACSGGTVILTFANTAPNGYSCPPATDQTTKAPFYQSASTTTSVTFTGTGSSGDVISFGLCTGY